MPEVKQFTQGDFANTFEGSATDFLQQLATQNPPPVATTTPPPATTAPVTTPPLETNNTLKPEDDAAALLADKPEEESTEEQKIEEGKPAKPAKGRPPVEKLDASTQKLVSELINDKKLFGFADGKIETKKDLQDLLDANFNHRIESQQKEIYDGVFKSMTPAFQMVAQYATQVDSPAELLPLLQSTSSAERFAKLDEANPIHQELIVRERMRLNGDTDEIIDQEIADLKDRAKLAEKAKVYKPVVQGFYEKQTQQLLATKQREEQEYFQTVQANDQHIRKVLDSDSLDGIKLKNPHKGIVYELLAIPREEYGGGVGIYSVIDTLFQKGQFDKLAKIALLVGDEKAFEEVYGTKLRMANADNTIRKLNTAGQSAPLTPEEDQDELTPPVLARPSRSGFGFSTR